MEGKGSSTQTQKIAEEFEKIVEEFGVCAYDRVVLSAFAPNAARVSGINQPNRIPYHELVTLFEAHGITGDLLRAEVGAVSKEIDSTLGDPSAIRVDNPEHPAYNLFHEMNGISRLVQDAAEARGGGVTSQELLQDLDFCSALRFRLALSAEA